MLSCWNADANMRPQFSDIRQQFETILETNAENHYYIQMTD